MKKMQTFFIGIFILSFLSSKTATSANVFAQFKTIKEILIDTHPKRDKLFVVVEDKPEFIGGESALFKYISENIKYPKVARENNIEGTVYVGFVVEADGSITDVDVKRGVGGGCSEEAVRVISAMPDWKPGRQQGQPVAVAYTIPIKFKLGGDEKIYTVVEQKPEYAGGDTTMCKFLAANIKYPAEAIKKKTEGTVYIGFVVNADGSLSNFEIKRSVGDGCDDEALSVIKMMPNWIPGKNKNVPVRTSYTLPIKFKME